MALSEIGYSRHEVLPRQPLIDAKECVRSPSFFDRIRRPDLKEVITNFKPWSYWTMELYTKYIKGQGGLGMLASDTLEVAKKLGIPMVCITPFYSVERSHEVAGFTQQERYQIVRPEDRGFERKGEVSIATSSHKEVPLGVYVRKEGSVSVVTVYEPNMGELYAGDPNSDHRLYQEVALGFGGYKALELLNVDPSMNQQLNEAPTVFSALARLDARVQELQIQNPDTPSYAVFALALIETKEKTIYTNHTLVQAAEAEISLKQFEQFVFPNIKNESLKNWLKQKIAGKGGQIKLSTLAIELSGKKNGVSKAHAKEASKTYKDYDGKDVKFEGVTNGISLERWGDPERLDVYRKKGIIDDFGLPTPNYVDNLQAVSVDKRRDIKNKAKVRLREALRNRKDQYGNGVNLPLDAKIYNWRRRLAGYKRPGMMFDQPEKLASILQDGNIHVVMSGNAHPSDTDMTRELKRILALIDANPVLKERVHFIQNYDEDLSKVLAHGADVSINTPKVRHEVTWEKISTEACATGWMKDMLNDVLLISTDDGGIADPTVDAEERGDNSFIPAYLQVKGDDYGKEVESLYMRMREASQILDSDSKWKKCIEDQHVKYLPIISGARMEEHYINLGFPVTA